MRPCQCAGSVCHHKHMLLCADDKPAVASSGSTAPCRPTVAPLCCRSGRLVAAGCTVVCVLEWVAGEQSLCSVGCCAWCARFWQSACDTVSALLPQHCGSSVDIGVFQRLPVQLFPRFCGVLDGKRAVLYCDMGVLGSKS